MQGSNLKVLLFVIFAAFAVGALVLINSVLQEGIAPDDASADFANSFVMNQVQPQAGIELANGDLVEVGIATQLPAVDSGNNPAVAELVVSFDNTALEATGIRLGEEVLALNEVLDNDAGVVTVDLSHSGSGGFTGRNNLVILQFEVKDDSLSSTSVRIDHTKSTYGFPDVLDPESGILELTVPFAPDAQEPEAPKELDLLVDGKTESSTAGTYFKITWKLSGYEVSECKLIGLNGDDVTDFSENPAIEFVEYDNVPAGVYLFRMECGDLSDEIRVTVDPGEEPKDPEPPSDPQDDPDAPRDDDPVVCPADVMECPNGDYVSRDPEANCQFRACPNGDTKPPPPITPQNPESAICGNNICELNEENNCSEDCMSHFLPTTDNVAADLCQSFVYSDWTECISGKQYRKVIRRIPDSCVGGSPVLSRACVVPGQPSAGSSSVCAQDVTTCTDGTIVGRDPNKGCEFVCPGLSDCRKLPTCAYGELVDGGLVYCDLDPSINWCGYECTPLPRCAYGIDGQATCSLDGGVNWCDRIPGKAEDNLEKACVADYDHNGTIDLSDLGLFALNYKKEDIDCSLDLTGNDCRLDIADFQLFGQYYKESNICLNVSSEDQ